MLAAERRRVIAERLQASGQIVGSVLSEEFNVSEETIRRDLQWLEKEGIAKRIFGGAVLKSSSQQAPPYSVRKNTNIENKLLIARQLSKLIHDGDTIMVDESSTAAYAIRAIQTLHNITLITNSQELLREMGSQGSWTLISTGGTLKQDVMALVGPHTLRTVASYHVQYAILSCRGINEQLGLADSDDDIVQIKRGMIAASEHTILLADHRKFDRTGFVALGPLSLVDRLITDRQPTEAWQERLQENHVELQYPE